MTYFFIGIEIELIAEPHKVIHPLKRWVYYEKLATSLRYYRLNAVADDLKARYRKHAEHYDKWFITKDGSLGDPSHPAIPLEAVSPILRTDFHWEDEIDTFWEAWGRIFHMPRRSVKCGSHVHVSPGPNKCFSLSDLKSIACGIVFYAENLEEILPSSRQNNDYCVKNWTVESSDVGSWYGDGLDRDVELTIEKILEVRSKTELKEFMQDNRRVLWNFQHVVPGSTGTIEFRGGRGLRGPVRTKWWIAFVVAFVQLCAPQGKSAPVTAMCADSHACIKYFGSIEGTERPTTDEFWAQIRKASRSVQVDDDLPKHWQNLNETRSTGQFEDLADTLDSDDSETSSVISKDASVYSDSECSTEDEERMVAEMYREKKRKCIIL